MCDYILKEAGGKGKMVIIHGQKGTTPEVDRSKGCAESLKAYPDVKVVAEQFSNIWSQDEGFQIMQNMLQANPDVSIVFAQADGLALGAAQAIKVANPSQKIVVGGFDGDTAARSAQQGRLQRNGDTADAEDGPRCGRKCRQACRGRKGTPVQLMDATLTTKENVAGFIANHP